MKFWIREVFPRLRRALLRRPAAAERPPEVVRRGAARRLPEGSAPVLAELATESPVSLQDARRWQSSQSYRPLWIQFHAGDSHASAWLDPEGRPVRQSQLPRFRWRARVVELVEAEETAIESTLLVLMSEEIGAAELHAANAPRGARSRPWLRIDRLDDRLGALHLIKRLPLPVPEAATDPAGLSRPHRRGPYESESPLPETLTIDLLDPSTVLREHRASSAPRVLVLAPFLARGGAEHTLFETALALAAGGELEFAFVTLAPHRPELGDRRPDFRAVSPLIYSLGDLLHPDAMYGALLSLVDSLDVRLLYNANGSTLFYDYARRLRRDRPAIPIIDHLYDHEIGYITWYDAETPSFVDYCVAENRRIAEKLVAAGWERERVPVIWPCGRPAAAFPPEAARPAVRRELRRELGVGDDELLLLTAARAHPQKRPLDWVRLGERLRGQAVRLLWVGGGDLERELDAAIAASSADNLTRLPFRDDVPRLLLAADAALLVSDFEGLPVFLLEALQAGTPFVATDVGDIGDLARASGAGLVSGAPGDLDALAAAVERLLDPAGRATLAAHAAASGADYGVDGCARRYGDLFQRALRSR